MAKDIAKVIDFPKLLSTAKQHLIFHEYRTVISACVYGLELLRSTENLEDNDESSDGNRHKIALGVLAIQAVALDEGIDHVEAFVERWFGEIRAFPAEILQLCVCLYLHINNSHSAQKMIEEWLEDRKNQNHQGFDLVVELYIQNILIPKNQAEKAQNFLNACESISEKKKERLLLYVKRSQEVPSTCTSHSSISPLSSSENNIQEHQGTGTSFSLLLKVIRLCSTTSQVLKRVSLKSTLKTGARVVILMYFLYVVLTRTNMPGDIFSHGSGENLIWNAVKQAWRALFAPYHMIPQ
ncbi:peroxisome assembly protein 26 isoform X1 [Exaiptasia diaphana]|uniref:Uncharacterized protein n=1 Tax=Exaiptasia diaphana TaxID=2652724 RepID=A0A913WS91_EXADI|nr:peroxisome assembly protein 26 isoform X1 [Exaiptasia diaphana]